MLKGKPFYITWHLVLHQLCPTSSLYMRGGRCLIHAHPPCWVSLEYFRSSCLVVWAFAPTHVTMAQGTQHSLQPLLQHPGMTMEVGREANYAKSHHQITKGTRMQFLEKQVSRMSCKSRRKVGGVPQVVLCMPSDISKQWSLPCLSEQGRETSVG